MSVRTVAGVLIAFLVAGCATHARLSEAEAQRRRPPPGVEDALGHVVHLARPPRRIVSWAPNATEVLFALGLGDRVVGVTRYCDFPPEAKRKPKVGSVIAPSVERTLALRPDLVIAARLNDRRAIEGARRGGLPVFAIDPTSLADVYRAILSVGQLTNTTRRAKRVVGDMKRRVTAVRSQSIALQAKGRPRVLFIYQLNPIWTAGRGTFPDEIVRLAGGENAARSVSGFAAFSSEALVASGPDVLLVTEMGPGDTRRVLSHPALSKLRAVRERQVYPVDPDILSRAGPRLADAVQIVSEILRESSKSRRQAASRSTSSR